MFTESGLVSSMNVSFIYSYKSATIRGSKSSVNRIFAFIQEKKLCEKSLGYTPENHGIHHSLLVVVKMNTHMSICIS